MFYQQQIAIELTKIWSSKATNKLTKKTILNAYIYFEEKLRPKSVTGFFCREIDTKEEEK